MGYFTSGILPGVSRTDGTTAVNRTYQRVGNVPNGFTARETVATAPNQTVASSFIYRTFETRAKGGQVLRHCSIELQWPFEAVPGDGVVIGTVTFNKTGLHIPGNCPTNVRKDVRSQLGSLFWDDGPTYVNSQLMYDPLVDQVYPF